MKKRIAIGVSDFRKMLTGDYYYVDKTLFIKDILKFRTHKTTEISA